MSVVSLLSHVLLSEHFCAWVEVGGPYKALAIVISLFFILYCAQSTSARGWRRWLCPSSRTRATSASSQSVSQTTSKDRCLNRRKKKKKDLKRTSTKPIISECKTNSKSLINLKGARAGNNSLPNKGPYKRKDSASFSPGHRCFILQSHKKQIDMICRTNPVP